MGPFIVNPHSANLVSELKVLNSNPAFWTCLGQGDFGMYLGVEARGLGGLSVQGLFRPWGLG